MKLINIGFGNFINADRVVAAVSPDSAPVKRIIQNAKETGKLIDVTQGRKTLSVIVTDSGHIVLSYLKLEKLGERFTEDADADSEV